MPPIITQLRTEIESGPLAAELAPLVLVRHNVEAAAILNRADQPGWVPARHVVATLASVGKWGIVELAVRHRLLSDGNACPSDLYMLFATVQLAAYGSLEPPLRMEIAPLTAGASTLVTRGILTSGERDAILAGEVKVSRAEHLWGYGVQITAEQIGAAI